MPHSAPRKLQTAPGSYIPPLDIPPPESCIVYIPPPKAIHSAPGSWLPPLEATFLPGELYTVRNLPLLSNVHVQLVSWNYSLPNNDTVYPLYL